MRLHIFAIVLQIVLFALPAQLAHAQAKCPYGEYVDEGVRTNRCYGPQGGVVQQAVNRSNWQYDTWLKWLEYCNHPRGGAAPESGHRTACSKIRKDFAKCNGFMNGEGYGTNLIHGELLLCHSTNAWPEPFPERVAAFLARELAAKAASGLEDALEAAYPDTDSKQMAGKVRKALPKALTVAMLPFMSNDCAKNFNHVLEASLGSPDAVVRVAVDAAQAFTSASRLLNSQQCNVLKQTEAVATPAERKAFLENEEHQKWVKFCRGRPVQVDAEFESRVVSSLRDQYTCPAR